MNVPPTPIAVAWSSQVLLAIAGLAPSSRSPKTLSLRAVSVIASGEVLATSTRKVTVPPGSGSVSGSAVLVGVDGGQDVVEPNRGRSSSDTGVALAVDHGGGGRVLVIRPEASPLRAASNEHVKVPPVPSAVGSVGHELADHRRVGRVEQIAEHVVAQRVRVTGSTESLRTSIVKVTVPPGLGDRRSRRGLGGGHRREHIGEPDRGRVGVRHRVALAVAGFCRHGVGVARVPMRRRSGRRRRCR